MSLFGKKAGKFLGNVMKEIARPGQQRQHSLQQEQHQQQHQQQQLHEPQLQGNQAGGEDFFQQPFFAPPLEGQQQQHQENNNITNNNGDFSHHAPPLDQSNNGRLDILKLPDQFNNTIPDFSMVGYREGHVRIPSVPTRIVLEPSRVSTEDDTARIQAAIDQVAQLPLESVGPHGAAVRGTILLRAGVYRVAGALIINASGVVLRGEGQDENGTIVVATGAIQRDFILVNGQLASEMGSIEKQQAKARTKEMMPSNGYRGSKKTTTTRSGVYIPVGENRIPVEDVGPFKAGDRIVIERPGTNEWIRDIGMDQLPPRPDSQDSVQWSPQTFTFRFERTIVDIDPLGILVLDIPLVMSLDPKYPPAKIFTLEHKFPMITDVGIEDLRLLSETDPVNAEDEHHGWYAVVLDNVAHAWVADVTTMQFVSGVYAATWSRFVTVQDCSVLYPVSKPREGGRRYQFCLCGQMGLVKRCYTNNARHDFITLGRVCGPNVFVDSVGENANNDTGPHERWAMGTLYDNITCNTINVRQRMWKGSGQGWAGAYQVVYNCTAKSSNSCFQDAPGATNWIIGFKGGQTVAPEFEGQMARVTAVDSTVEPRSLYWAQLADRVGDTQYVEESVGASSKIRYPPRI